MSQSNSSYPSSGSGGTVTKQSIIESLGYKPTSASWSLPTNNYNPEFLFWASCIVAPTNNYSNGATITWAFLDHATSHGNTFFSSAAGDGASKRLQINYPAVKKVFNGTITPDEGFAGIGASCGATVDLTNMQIHCSVMRPIGIRLRGAGTTTWAKNGQVQANFDISAYSTADGGTSFNYTGTAIGLDYDTFSITYFGPNRYTISKTYSGLGAYNIRFNIRDAAGALLTTNPTASDEIQITSGATAPIQIFLDAYAATNPNQYLSTLSNFWILCLFEAWMLVSPSSSTSNLVKWQNTYPSATAYKIYRDTQSSFATQTLIYTGTGSSFLDTGLTSNTLYFYKMIAVVASVDTLVTTFNSKTD
jgi:hypothetical protein